MYWEVSIFINVVKSLQSHWVFVKIALKEQLNFLEVLLKYFSFVLSKQSVFVKNVVKALHINQRILLLFKNIINDKSHVTES